MLEEWVLRGAALVAAVGVIWRVVVPIRRWAKSLGGDLAILKTLAREQKTHVQRTAEVVEAELQPNGGHSVKDDIKRLSEGQHDLAALVTTFVALGQAQQEHFLDQLRRQGLDIADLPDAKLPHRRRTGEH